MTNDQEQRAKIMTYTIFNQCIACQKCLSYCPTEVIKQKENTQNAIASNLNNDSIEFYEMAQYMTEPSTVYGCSPTISSLIQATTSATNNYWDNWFATYNRLTSKLKSKQETQYWQHWFDIYSQKLERLVISQ